VAAAALTVTSMRERVVDFTQPFLVTRIVALVKTSHAARWHIHSVEDLSRQSRVKYAVLQQVA